MALPSNLIPWPVDKFGAPLLKSYGLKRQANFLRTDMSTGHVRQRRITASQVPTTMSAEWLIPANHRNDFIGFIDYALQGGIAYFSMPILVGDKVIEHQCRFITHPAEDETPTLRYTVFKSQIEVKQVYRSDEDDVVNAILAPYTWNEFIGNVDMSRYYTESWKHEQ
ncbi:hypothetical protein [Photobacterium leiognathi]|uniref:hypothetical protein n=1 Tax=Photobacterium leiognathi TaxID=553611 RepID=UPI000D16050A|nr:hypothetical protein [Photobacterium leiognathi]PSW53065.1 hypothetical protein C0W50_19850 [Photobacterium leiognathi subsp. mandapamensis]